VVDAVPAASRNTPFKGEQLRVQLRMIEQLA